MGKTTTTTQMLEYMADITEGVLVAHRKPGRVTGGTIGPQVIRFYLSPAPHIRFSEIERLRDDLALALRTQEVRIERSPEGIQLEFANPHPTPVSFQMCLDADGARPATSALLGMMPNGNPLFAQLSSPDVAHVLVSGTTGSGKSVLLRVMLASLMLKNDPAVMRVLTLDPKNRLLPRGFSAPHLLRAVTTPDEFGPTLHDLVHTMEQRDKRRETKPHIAVFIDELSDIVMNVEGACSLIERLVQRGREAGIHVVAAAQHPSSAILGPVMRANFPLRLVGRVASADDARVAAGKAGTHAEQLNGHGDFLAVHAGSDFRFQTPLVTDVQLSTLLRTVQQVTVANVLEAAPAMLAESTDDDPAAARIREDTTALMERARREGRMPTSKREAERWLFDVNRGGIFFDRASEALAEAWRDGFDLTESRPNGMITAIVRKVAAIAG
jgi:S-DNA-T family DNA segregation ATPase FtsK/SpoIIIE